MIFSKINRSIILSNTMDFKDATVRKISFEMYLKQHNCHNIMECIKDTFYKIINPIEYILIEEDLMVYEKNSEMTDEVFLNFCTKKNIEYNILDIVDYVPFSLKHSLPCPIIDKKNIKNKKYIIMTKKNYFKLLFTCKESKDTACQK